jgi:tRNA U34 5-carboxymethylaminomethyl modifying GTPase MnmE/TrmE
MESRKPRERRLFDKLFKISIVGESGVGKSSILNGFLGKFD